MMSGGSGRRRSKLSADFRFFSWEEDLGFALEAVHSINTSFYPDQRFDEEGFLSTLRQSYDFEPDGVMIVEREGERVGFLFLRSFKGEKTPYGLVSQLYIVPEARGKGLGLLALKRAESYFRERGMKKVRLRVSAENEIALSLYREAGFSVEELKMVKALRRVK